MSRSHRVDLAGAPAADAAEASASTERAAAGQDPQALATSFVVEGVVLEVLAGYGLAHLRAADGSTYGLNQWTPGIHLAELREGQRVRAEVTRKFSRVVHAVLLGESSAQSLRGSDEEGGARR